MSSHDPNRPTVPEVLPLVRALYLTEHGMCGCCAHVILDDGNLDQEFADLCLERALERDHEDCIVICRALAAMSWTQRKKLYITKWGR